MLFFFALGLLASVATAQPSPDVQAKISQAIQDAIDSPTSNPNYASFVNPFIGTGRIFCGFVNSVTNARVFQTTKAMYGEVSVTSCL